MTRFWQWVGRAEPWHFWNPGSGGLGGSIAGGLVLLAIFAWMVLA